MSVMLFEHYNEFQVEVMIQCDSTPTSQLKTA